MGKNEGEKIGELTDFHLIIKQVKTKKTKTKTKKETKKTRREVEWEQENVNDSKHSKSTPLTIRLCGVSISARQVSDSLSARQPRTHTASQSAPGAGMLEVCKPEAEEQALMFY